MTVVMLTVMTMMTMSTVCLAEDNLCGQGINYCPELDNSTTGDALSFVDYFPPQPMYQIATTCFYLTCCTATHLRADTTWYKNLMELDCVEADLDCYRHISDNGQSLIVENAGAKDDSGLYRCVVTDGIAMISRTFDVRVAECPEKPPRVKFSHPSETQSSLGRSYTQVCRGDFGCQGAWRADNLAWWAYADSDGLRRNLTEGTVRGRYSVNMTYSADGTKKAAVLTIEDVMADDFRTTFFCSLKMGDLPTVGFNFTLTETERRTAWKRYVPVIVAMSVLAFLLIVVGGVVHRFCRPIVMYSWTHVTGSFPKKDPEQHEYDVMLVTRSELLKGDADTAVLEAMENDLKDKGYTLYPFVIGPEAGTYDDVEKCVTVIFIIDTPTLESEREQPETEPQQPDYLAGFEFYFNIATAARTNILFVCTHPPSKRAWEKLSQEYSKVFRHMPKMCTTLSWLGTAPSWLTRTNFWCQVRRFLPEPQSSNEGGSAKTGEAGVVGSSSMVEEGSDPKPVANRRNEAADYREGLDSLSRVEQAPLTSSGSSFDRV